MTSLVWFLALGLVVSPLAEGNIPCSRELGRAPSPREPFADVFAANDRPRDFFAHGNRVEAQLRTWSALAGSAGERSPLVRLGADRRGLLVDRRSLLHIADWQLNGMTGSWDSTAAPTRLLQLLDDVVRRRFIAAFSSDQPFRESVQSPMQFDRALRWGYRVYGYRGQGSSAWWALERRGVVQCLFQYEAWRRCVRVVAPLPDAIDIRDDWNNPASSSVASVTLHFVPEFGFRLAAAEPLRQDGRYLGVRSQPPNQSFAVEAAVDHAYPPRVEAGHDFASLENQMAWAWQRAGCVAGTLTSATCLVFGFPEGLPGRAAVLAPVWGWMVGMLMTVVAPPLVEPYYGWRRARANRRAWRAAYAELVERANTTVYRLLMGEPLVDGHEELFDAGHVGRLQSEYVGPVGLPWHYLWMEIHGQLTPAEERKWRMIFARLQSVEMSGPQTMALVGGFRQRWLLESSEGQLRQNLDRHFPPAIFPSWEAVLAANGYDD